MNLILLALLIPFSFAGTDFCTQTGNMLATLEKKLAAAKVNGDKCDNLKVADLIQGHPGITDEKFIHSRRCHNLASIESELERLRAELSVATGIVKLKETVRASQEEVKNGAQRQAGMTFVSSLDTAQSLEILLATSSHQNKPFIQMLKELPAEERKNQLDVSNAIKKFCEQKSSTDQDACNPRLFKPGPDAVNEILKLIETTPEVNEVQVTKWQSMLAIQKENGNAQWSFTEMKQELESAFDAIDKKQTMTREHLNAIKKLDSFKNAPGFSFVEDIAAAKSMNQVKIMSDKLLVLMGDARARQQYEVQSKVSVLWDSNRHLFNSLSQEKQETCNKARFLYDQAALCHSYLEQEKKNFTSAQIKDVLLPSINSSILYINKLNASETKCKDELAKSENKIIPESCADDVSKVAGDIQNQIRQLIIMKDKIGSENEDLMTYRNFALKKWSEKCSTQQSSMDQCDIMEDYAISKNAMLAVKDTMSVAIMFTPTSNAEEKAKALCEDEDKIPSRPDGVKELCDQLKTTPVVVGPVIPQKKEEPKPEVEAFDPVAAQNRDRMIMASRGLLTDALRDWLNYRFSSPESTFNPYQYNYTPYNMGQPVLGIADSIMFNARYYGSYGFYMPTPGYQPYTAFAGSSAVSAYKPAAVTYPSRYFSK